MGLLEPSWAMLHRFLTLKSAVHNLESNSVVLLISYLWTAMFSLTAPWGWGLSNELSPQTEQTTIQWSLGYVINISLFQRLSVTAACGPQHSEKHEAKLDKVPIKIDGVNIAMHWMPASSRLFRPSSFSGSCPCQAVEKTLLLPVIIIIIDT